ncbi:MAG: hypothetical protein HY775_13385 [Acidobacteria bacterium]|nr:hypothetical protein [Acidobacteriota bacterium]
MRRAIARVGLGTAALLLLVLPGARATTPDRADATGTATSTLFRLSAGSTVVSAVGDVARAARNGSTEAFAAFTSGRTDGTTLGAKERRATDDSSSGSDSSGPATLSVPALLSIQQSGVRLETLVRDAFSSSTVSAEVGAVDALAGLATFDGARSVSDIVVNDDLARVARTIAVDRVRIFALADLLARLGVDPLKLACGAIEQTGDLLGVSQASVACERLGEAQGGIAGAKSALDAAAADLVAARDGLQADLAGKTRATAQANRDTVAGLSCGALDVICQTNMLATLVGYGATYGVDVSGSPLDGAKAAVLAAIDATLAAFDALDRALADLAVVNGGIADAASGTCAATESAARAVAAGVPALAGTLDPIAGAISDACGGLLVAVRAVLDTPLLSLGGVSISVKATARAGHPAVEVAGTMDEIKVGLDAPFALPVALPEAAQALTEQIGGLVGAVTSALGIELPAPALEFMAVDSGAGQRYDGAWYAEGSVTLLRIHLPSATISLPASNPLGLLSPGGIAGARAPRASKSAGTGWAAGLPATSASTPAVTLDLGAFDAVGEFLPATTAAGPGPGGGDGTTAPEVGGGGAGQQQLPTTGAGLGVAGVMLGAGALAGAGAIRRFLRVR